MPLSPPIRLNILSDLHLSRGPLDFPHLEADIIILAGDISRPMQAIKWAAHLTQPVIYVAGNHEFYGNSINGTLSELKRRCAGTHIHVLDKSQVVLNGVRFLGATLWTHFLLYGDGPMREQAIADALQFIRDYSQIESGNPSEEKFSPAQSQALFHAQRNWLEQQLALPFNGPTVVVTHHAPSPKSIHPRFAGSMINACFVSDLEYLMGADRVALWVHGHTHDSFDYSINGTRVVCNPRGYLKDGLNENALFDANLVIQVG